MELNKDLNVATPEEFVRQFGGNRVINRVSNGVSCVVYVSGVSALF
jgi:hypothetical protein